MTLREWVSKGAAQLETGPHPEKARRDAETLLLFAAGLSRSAFLSDALRRVAGASA
jgi:hypothetical protein